MAAEAGKTVAEADPEVSEAIDFARYYADRALELEPSGRHAGTDGARFTPTAMTLVTPPWNFPVAIPIGGALAALAAGSAVVVKPAPPVPGCAEVAVAAVRAALAEGGAPADLLQVVRTDEGDVGRALVAHPDVDTVLLTGSIETARLFSSWRAAHDGGPTCLRRDVGQERARHHVGRRLRPGRRRPREERVRACRSEVLGRVARDPGRVGRTFGAAATSARRRRRIGARRAGRRRSTPRWGR